MTDMWLYIISDSSQGTVTEVFATLDRDAIRDMHKAILYANPWSDPVFNTDEIYGLNQLLQQSDEELSKPYEADIGPSGHILRRDGTCGRQLIVVKIWNAAAWKDMPLDSSPRVLAG